MPFAITLTLDTDAAPRITAMWETLAARGLSSDAINLGYKLHLTLAVLPDTANAARLCRVVASIAAGSRPLGMRLASFGWFPGPPAAVFLRPGACPTLIERHAAVLTALSGETIDPHYLAGGWLPHVTLAKDLADPAAAIACLTPSPFPLDCVLDTMEVVHFRPVRIMASHILISM